MRERVSKCFKPSQPQRIISGLRETFIERHSSKDQYGRTGPEEQGEKAESFRESLRNEIQLKGP